ncbi:MAG TPA: hypothetical protein VFY73_10720 [Ideonella sp.]|uniref:hypothetical protein n=1 Tax=Ideonella sp. TaxID=1929293 RepID=UPI002E323A98|nr:hypothetical protein [Ideonella sp.]HEX5684492.1 hypothetical protein [Ideonella sp.]
MSSRYIRTAAGQAEIQARALKLSRPVRNLLLVINDSRTIEDWLVQVHGVTPDDVALLRSEGLITEANMAGAPAGKVTSRTTTVDIPVDIREGAAAQASAPAAASAAGNDADWTRTQQVIRSAGYTALYDALTSVGKAKLGLMRGYRFVLEVEKCTGPDELRAFALKFAEQLRTEHGMAAVGELTYAIGAVKA